MSQPPLVRLRGIHKVYRSRGVETDALRGLDLDIHIGDFVVLHGPSGCGKSTLLAILGLMEAPSAGSMEFAGARTEQLSDGERARIRGRDLGFVFQAFHLVPQLTVQQNVELPLSYHRTLAPAERRARAAQWIERVGLTDRAGHYPDQLSGGQQQRAAIARALAAHPRLILADEPTGNLDTENGAQAMALLHEANAQGTTICLVTHDPAHIHAGNRALELKDGSWRSPEHAT